MTLVALLFILPVARAVWCQLHQEHVTHRVRVSQSLRSLLMIVSSEAFALPKSQSRYRLFFLERSCRDGDILGVRGTVRPTILMN